MTVAFDDTRFLKVSELRLREMPEWDCVLVFTPHQPELHVLNLTSWAIMELCAGQPFDHLRAEFQDAVGDSMPAAEVDRHLSHAVRSLERKGIVRRVDETLALSNSSREEVESDV